MIFFMGTTYLDDIGIRLIHRSQPESGGVMV
jgi:hypothetical protein